jgi:hypothetical protein
MIPSILRIARPGFLLPLCVILLALPSCEEQESGTIDPPLSRPFLASAAVMPDSLKTSTLPQSNGAVTVTVNVLASISLQAGTDQAEGVTADLLDPVSGSSLAAATLRDDGIAPDTMAGDGKFAGVLTFTLPKSVSGRYIVRTATYSTDGVGANAIETPLYFIRDNNPPVLSNLVMPDTLSVPSGGNANFVAKVTASDADGQADITQVFFVNLDSSDPNQRYPLYDDGSNTSNSGDAVAGDGIYTITVTAPSSAKGRSYRFRFQAIDAFGDTSTSILHDLTIM